MSSEPCYTGLALKGVEDTACKKEEGRCSSGESEIDMRSALFSCMLQEWRRKEASAWEHEHDTEKMEEEEKKDLEEPSRNP